MRNLWLLIGVAGAMLGCEKIVEPVRDDHPVLGLWRLTSNDGCLETYQFRTDNRVLIASGQEIAEVRSMLSATPDAQRFYRWEHTLVKHNGEKDCAGNIVKMGTSDTWFIQLSQAGDRLIFCQKPSTDACFGPLQRVR